MSISNIEAKRIIAEKFEILKTYNFRVPNDNEGNVLIDKLLLGLDKSWEYDLALSQLCMLPNIRKLNRGDIQIAAYKIIVDRFVGRGAQRIGFPN